MSVTNFIPEIWAATLLSSLKKSLVFGSSYVVNRNYEGEIRNAGDTVRITSISRPTVAPYTAGSTSITPEQLTDSQRSLVVDQCKYFAFEVDDVDARQAANGGALMDEAATEAAYALGDSVDQYIAGLFTEADTDNEISTTTINTGDLALQYLVELKIRLDKKDVPSAPRYVIIPPWYHGLLLRSTAFNSAANYGSNDVLMNGEVGRAFGFRVLVSNNCASLGSNDWRVYAGHPTALTFAEQINKVEAYRPEDSFSDALKGLHLYGAKIVRPQAIATLVASTD